MSDTNNENKQNNSEQKPKKKFNKWLLFGIIGFIVIAVISAIAFGFYYFSSRTTSANYTELTKFEDGGFYLPNAKKNITFDIIPKDRATDNLYTIVDGDNNAVETTTSTKDGYVTIKPPKGNYVLGNTYTLTLNNATFKDEELKDVSTLTFKIERKEIEEYSYKENVKELQKSDVVITATDDIATVKVNSADYKENDILLIQDQENIEAYKVTKVENDILTVTTPELTDIYETLNVYKTYDVDYNSIVVTEELKEQVEVTFKKSAIYQFLVNESKASSPQTDIDIETSAEGISVVIKVELLPDGESNLGLKILANHKVTIDFKYDFKCSPTLDIDFPNKIDVTTAFTQDLDFNINIVPDEEILTGIKDLTEEEYNKSVMEIVNKLSKVKYDTTSGSQEIITLPIKTKIPGLTFNIDFFTVADFNFATDVTFNHKTNSTLVIGILINEDGCKMYKTNFAESKDTEFTITGKANFEFGIMLDINLTFINKDIAYVGITTETGLYGDMYITFPLIHKNKEEGLIKTDYVGSLEIGIFFRSKFDAYVDLLVKEIKETKEFADDKYPILDIGNDTITTGIVSSKESINIEDGKVTLPTFEKIIQNILTDDETKEKLEVSQLKFTNGDKKELTVKENKIEVPDKDDTITVTYTENDKEYKTTFKINKKEKFIKVGNVTLKYGKYKGDFGIDGWNATITLKENGTATYVGHMSQSSGKKYVNLTGKWEIKENSIGGLVGPPDNPTKVDGIFFYWSDNTDEAYGISNNYFGDQWHGFKWVSE